MNSKLKIQNFSQHIILLILFFLPFYFIKLKCGWISLNLIEILIIALAVVWIWENWSDGNSCKDWKKYQLPLGLIFLGIISSILVNKNYYVGFGILKGWFILPVIFAVILWEQLKKDEGMLDKTFATLFASGVLVSIEGIYYKFSGFLTFDGRLRIFFDSPNQLAMFLVPAFLIGISFTQHAARNLAYRQAGRQHKINWKASLLLATGLVIIFLNLYFTKSFGSWAALASTLVIVFLLKYRELSNKKYLLLSLIILLIIFGWAGVQKYESAKEMGARSSFASRIMIWKSAGLMTKTNPLFGIGPGNFQNKYLEYQKYFPPYLEWSVPQPHNLFLAFWLEAGLMGLMGFIFLLVLFFRDNKKAIQGNRNLGFLCLGIMLYFLLHGLIDTTYWRSDLAILFWVVIAVNSRLAFGNEKLDIEKSKIPF